MAAAWDAYEAERHSDEDARPRVGILSWARGWLLPLLLYVGLALLLFASTWQDPFRRVIGPGGDSLQFMWFLGWSAFALGHHINPLFSNVINAPDGVDLMWNAAMPLPAALLSPVTRSLGPVFSYNLLITLGVALSAFSAFLAVRRYVKHSLAAVVAGLIYGFSPYEAAHALDHPHVAVAFFPPLVLLILDDLFLRHRHPPILMGAALGMLGAAQLLTGEELLASTALIVIVTAVLAFALRRAPGWTAALRAPSRLPAGLRAQVGPLLAAATSFLLLAAVPMVMQFLGPQRVGGPLQPRNEYVSDLLNLVVPTAVQQVAPDWAKHLSGSFPGAPGESTAYLGLPLLLLLAWITTRSLAIRRQADPCGPDPFIRLASLVLLACVLLSFGLTLHLAGHNTLVPCALLMLPLLRVKGTFPGRFLLFVVLITSLAITLAPVVDNLLPARLMLFAFLAAAVVVAITLDQHLTEPLPGWLRRLPLPARLVYKREVMTRVLAAGTIGVALLPLLPRIPFSSTGVPLPAYFSSSAVRQIPENSVVLVAPFARSGHGTAMLWQALAEMRFRMPEGYVFVPHHANLADPPASATLDILTALELGQQPVITSNLRDALLGDLQRWHVNTVLVGPMPYRARVIALYIGLLGSYPEEEGQVAVFRRPATP